MFNLFSFQQIAEFKSCTLYDHKNINTTHIIKYFCYQNEVCCDSGNGCCPIRPTKYYESWCFWIFVFGIILACYLLCWYCKKIEKERQTVRANVGNERQSTRILPCLRPVDEQSVDHLLETLILNYRSRLINQNQSAPNVERANKPESPPEYSDAIQMPKPDELAENCSTIADCLPVTSHSVNIDISTSNTLEIEDGIIPSYEEAVKNIGK